MKRLVDGLNLLKKGQNYIFTEFEAKLYDFIFPIC